MIKNAVGLIALDIDGTITADMRAIPDKVISYFISLHEKGWGFVFITGRTFDFGYKVLKELPFIYHYAVQNGAILLEMPQQKILAKKYLDKSMIPALESLCKEESTDFVIYAGMEYGNQCFYRPKRFSKELTIYLEARCRGFRETWSAIDTFQELSVHEFASIKWFGRLEPLLRLAQKIEKNLNLHAPVIKDPFNQDYYVVQATHPHVSKGRAVSDLIKLSGYTGKIIAAGDDLNDLSMFKQADIAIAMDTAPETLKRSATIIAPSALQQGIIQGLKIATERINV